MNAWISDGHIIWRDFKTFRYFIDAFYKEYDSRNCNKPYGNWMILE